MSRPAAFDISPQVACIRRGLVLRASSLLISVFGDSIAPREHAVWLGSLIELVRMFGLSDRLVRTSASRLKEQGWFAVTRMGPRSFYALSEFGMQRVRRADRHIYDFGPSAREGRWTLLLVNNAMRASARQRLERELLWEGFGRLAPGVFAHPREAHDSLAEILAQAGAQDLVAVLSAESVEAYSRESLPPILRTAFRQAEVQNAWHRFIARFAPASALLPALTPAEAFFVRTLLIHEYRRVRLRDPNLPQALVSPDWPGAEAGQLCDRLYGELLGPSEQFLQAHLRVADAPAIQAAQAPARRTSAAVPLCLAA